MNETQTVKLTRTGTNGYSAYLGTEYAANVTRVARGEYRVTYFYIEANGASTMIDRETMRDNLKNVELRLQDWLDMATR